MAAANAELPIRVRALRGGALRGMDRLERETRGVGRGAHRAAPADGGGRRPAQKADGIAAAVADGAVAPEDGESAGETPGATLRGPRS